MIIIGFFILHSTHVVDARISSDCITSAPIFLMVEEHGEGNVLKRKFKPTGKWTIRQYAVPIRGRPTTRPWIFTWLPGVAGLEEGTWNR